MLNSVILKTHRGLVSEELLNDFNKLVLLFWIQTVKKEEQQDGFENKNPSATSWSIKIQFKICEWVSVAFHMQKICPVISVSSHHCLPSVCASPVEFRDRVSSCFPDVWRHVRRSLFDGQHHYGHDYGDSDAGEDSQGAGSD